MKHRFIIISKLFTWIGFGKIQKDFEMIDKLLESQNKTENGQGKFTSPDGMKFSGVWKDGLAHGQVTAFFKNGDSYVGEFKKGNADGQGTLTFHDGGKYVGEYKNNLRNGQGTQTYSDGKKYVGEWKDDKYHGQGIQTIPNQGKYVGEWKDDIAWNGIIFDKNEKILAKRKNGA